MKHIHFCGVLALAFLLSACAHRPGGSDGLSAASRVLDELKARQAPDDHLAVFTLGLKPEGRMLVLTGEVDRAEVKSEVLDRFRQAGLAVEDRATVLPDARLGDKCWGIASLSLASAREGPEHKAEMGTQVLMGNVVRLLKPGPSTRWYYAQSKDGYLAWLEKGTFVRCTREEADAWQRGPLLIVTALDDLILSRPEAGAEPVSDVVLTDLVKLEGEQENWYEVGLPDGRRGFLRKAAAQPLDKWKAGREATPESLERTARQFLGRPYLWGANSPRGMDCSGFTRTVFYLNGVELRRNAGHQALEGEPVPIDAGLSQLKKGDLLFFGRENPRDGQLRIVHVGMYLEDKLFIHSSERVQINSLDPNSPIRDEHRIRTLVGARRMLK